MLVDVTYQARGQHDDFVSVMGNQSFKPVAESVDILDAVTVV